MLTSNRQNIAELLNQGLLREAKGLLDTLVDEEQPLSLEVDYFIALYHVRQLVYDLAIPHLLKIVESSSSPIFLPKAYKILCYCLIKQTRYLEARQILEDFGQDFDWDLDVKNMLAFILLQTNRLREAVALYQEIITADSTNLTAKNAMANIFLDIYEDGQAALDLLGSYQEHDARILDTIGWAYFQVGNMKKAKEYLDKALDIMPEEPEITKHLTILISHMAS